MSDSRIADALYQLAAAQRELAKAAKQSNEYAREMLEMQKANLAVTKHLEAELALRASGNYGGTA